MTLSLSLLCIEQNEGLRKMCFGNKIRIVVKCVLVVKCMFVVKICVGRENVCFVLFVQRML